MTMSFTRRTFVGATVAAGGLALAGCGSSERPAANVAEANGLAKPGPSSPAQPRLAAMTVYRDPSCGCCEAWANQARTAGFEVTLIDHSDMPAIKRQHGVPEELVSCHTGIVAGYAVEGHVPFADIARLLKSKPAGVRGIAVPGMPRGSPGMEMPDGAKDEFQVMAFDAAGKSRPFVA